MTEPVLQPVLCVSTPTDGWRPKHPLRQKRAIGVERVVVSVGYVDAFQHAPDERKNGASGELAVPDLAVANYDSDDVAVLLGRGDGSFAQTSFYPTGYRSISVAVGDVNGDGNADAVGFGLDGVYVALSTGSSFSPVTKWVEAFDEVHGWTNSLHVRTVADVNGDGDADAVGFGLDGIYVALSNGADGFDPVTKWVTAFDQAHGWTVTDHVRTLADVDGDGDADAVGFGLDGVYVALSNGVDGFDPVSKWVTAFDQAHGWTNSLHVRTLADVNGDGITEIVISLKDVLGGGQGGVQVWEVSTAGIEGVLWPTGRGSYLRIGSRAH